MSGSFLTDARKNSKEAEHKYLGHTYDYAEKIRTPHELGMGSEGSMGQLADNVSGLLGYVQILISGEGKAKKNTKGSSLGNQYFLDTGTICSNINARTPSEERVKRSIYINNVADGNVPFISNGSLPGVPTESYKGLVPGVMGNMAQINPTQVFSSILDGNNPKCQLVEMETIDVSGNKSTQSGFITNEDILNMPTSWFPNGIRPEVPENFSNFNDDIDFSKMPNDIYIKMYYLSISILLLYIFIKAIRK